MFEGLIYEKSPKEKKLRKWERPDQGSSEPAIKKTFTTTRKDERILDFSKIMVKILAEKSPESRDLSGNKTKGEKLGKIGKEQDGSTAHM